jgi:hypothetical protein
MAIRAARPAHGTLDMHGSSTTVDYLKRAGERRRYTRLWVTGLRALAILVRLSLRRHHRAVRAAFGGI